MNAHIRDLLDVSCLKGSRDYVHSTQMFDAIRPVLLKAGCSPDDRLTMIFRRLTGNVPRFVFPGSVGKTAIGDVVVTGREKTVGVIEETDSPVSGRRPDHESELFATLTIGDGWASARGASPLSPIEVAVAATKYLHQHQVSASVKWLATRLDLPMSFDAKPDDELKIEIVANRNGITTSTAVLINGGKVGTIGFNSVASR